MIIIAKWHNKFRAHYAVPLDLRMEIPETAYFATGDTPEEAVRKLRAVKELMWNVNGTGTGLFRRDDTTEGRWKHIPQNDITYIHTMLSWQDKGYVLMPTIRKD